VDTVEDIYTMLPMLALSGDGAAPTRGLVAEVRRHELLVIASPIRIDALPALVTRTLEAILADRECVDEAPPLTVLLLLDCGFPESRHASVAATIGVLFARRVRARWAGALQVGAGAVIHGRPLAEAGHGSVRRRRRRPRRRDAVVANHKTAAP